MAEGSHTISVWVQDADIVQKSALPDLARKTAVTGVQVQADILRENIRRYVAEFGDILSEPITEDAGYHIDEIELALSVNASGGIELIGKVALGVQAAIKVKLKRNA